MPPVCPYCQTDLRLIEDDMCKVWRCDTCNLEELIEWTEGDSTDD
jgi:ribosomal protein L37AE/L43A